MESFGDASMLHWDFSGDVSGNFSQTLNIQEALEGCGCILVSGRQQDAFPYINPYKYACK